MYLYHASTTQGLKTLEPRQRYTPSRNMKFPAIYATPLAAYAATHSFPWSTDEGVKLNTADGVISLSVPESFRERIQVPISIYKLPDTNFVHTDDEVTGHTWHTTESVGVLEEIKYDSVEKALTELGAHLTFV